MTRPMARLTVTWNDALQQDKTMMLWDLRVQNCQGLLKVPSGVPTAAFDQQVISTYIACAENADLHGKRLSQLPERPWLGEC